MNLAIVACVAATRSSSMRVRAEPGVEPSRRPLVALLDQDLEHLRDPSRVDPRAHRVLDPRLVRLRFVASAERRHDPLSGHPHRHVAAVGADRREDAAENHPQVHALPGLHLLHAVPLDHVPDLVPEHSGELIHRRRALDQSAIHVDESPGDRERIDLRTIDDVEPPVEITVVGDAGDRVAEHIDVAHHLRVANDRELRIDLLGIVGPELDLLAASRSRTRRAGAAGMRARWPGQRRTTAHHEARGRPASHEIGVRTKSRRVMARWYRRNGRPVRPRRLRAMIHHDPENRCVS